MSKNVRPEAFHSVLTLTENLELQDELEERDTSLADVKTELHIQEVQGLYCSYLHFIVNFHLILNRVS